MIKTYNLAKRELTASYRQKLETKIVEKEEDWNKVSVKQMWSEFKEVILNTAGEICGTTKIYKRKKQTSWWSEEVKKQIKVKQKKNMWSKERS